MKTNQIAINYNGLNAKQLAIKGNDVYTKLNGNPSFTSVSTYLPLLNTAVNNLNTAINVGGLNPNIAQTTAISTAQRELKNVLKVIAALVNFEANGDVLKLTTTGFDLRVQAVKSAKSFNAMQGAQSGSVDLEINSYGTAAYVWEVSPDPISDWEIKAVSTISKVTISGLTPGVKYWFRVKVTKGKTQTAISDPYIVHVV